MPTRNGSRRIVVGIDGSPQSQTALDWAVCEAAATGGEVDAVIAFDSGLAWIDVGSDYQSRIIEHAAAQAHEELHRVIKGLQPTVPVHPLVVEGEAATVLVELARNAELLVVAHTGVGASPVCCSVRSVSAARNAARVLSSWFPPRGTAPETDAAD